MSLLKIAALCSLLLSISSCSILKDFLAPDNLVPEIGITETKDRITDEVKYTSDKIVKLYEERKPIITPGKNDNFNVLNAIKINPYLIKTNDGFEYFLQVSVTGQQGLVTNELMLKCDGTPFRSHKITEDEKKGVNILEHSLKTSKRTSFYYQEEVIVTKVSADLFNYLGGCISDILMRAKGLKGSIDSSMQHSTGDTKVFYQGMAGFKSVIESNPVQAPKT
jgi:hypothetical protein